MDDLKKLKAAATEKLAAAELGKVAGNAVTGASGLIDSAESVAQRSGFTNKKGEISKLKVAKAAVTPAKSTRKLLGAVAEEIETRRNGETP